MNSKTKSNWRLSNTTAIARAKDKHGNKIFNWVREEPRDPKQNITKVTEIGPGTTGIGVAWYTFRMPFNTEISIDANGDFIGALNPYKTFDDGRPVTDTEKRQIDASIQYAINCLEMLKEEEGKNDE